MTKYSRKLTSKHLIKKHTQFIKRKTNKNISKNNDFNKQFELANNIFKTITIKKEPFKNEKELYWIISNKYDSYLDNHKYTIIHFLLYCMLRFNKWDSQDLIQKYVLYPINFPTNIHYNSSYKYNSFNYLLYLNNFIYYLLETNQTIQSFLQHSNPNRFGYNISITTINNKPYYTIYFVINTRKLEISKILFSNNYPQYIFDKYFNAVYLFLKQNQQYFINNNFLTSVFTLTHSNNLDNKTKYIYYNDLYIPKCHLELSATYDDNLITYLIYKEILWQTPERIKKYISIFQKYRNIEQLKQDLLTANVSNQNFNDMIKSIKPLGFENKILYREFMKDLAKIISTKIKNFIIKIYGSSTTFYSANPDKEKGMFSYDKSDYDIIIIPTENIEHYKPELDYLVSKTYDINMGLYITPIFCEFFGTNILNPFFKKWGPCEFSKDTDKDYTSIENVNIKNTKLKRNISPFLSKLTMYYYFDILTQNKTCLPNFAMFINNGNTISYWDENNKYITNKF